MHMNDVFELWKVTLRTWFYYNPQFFTCNQAPPLMHKFPIYLSLSKQSVQWLSWLHQIDAWLQEILETQVCICKHSMLRCIKGRMCRKILISNLRPIRKLKRLLSVQKPIRLPKPLVLMLLKFRSLLMTMWVKMHYKILWIQH